LAEERSKNSSITKIILDANVWIKAIFGFDKLALSIIKKCLKGELYIIVNSYIIAEITRVLKRIAYRIGLNPLNLERKFWIIINSPYVIKDFKEPLSEDLLRMIRKKDEILVIAKTFNLEPKDVPYIVSAFKHRAIIITYDDRSLYKMRDEIKKKINVMIKTPKEFQK